MIIDPLLILKEHIQQGKKIEKRNNYLIFSDNLELRLDTPTAFIQSQLNKQYSLGSLWYFLKNHNLPYLTYKNEILKEGIDPIVALDKTSVIEFFINNIEDVKIINQDLRPKTLIFLGKKKHGDSLEKIMEEEKKTEISKDDKQDSNKIDVNSNKMISSVRPKHRSHTNELEPNLKVMNYIFSREKKSLNRNSILRIQNVTSSFESLLHLCTATFVKNKYSAIKSENISFLEELVSGESDLRGNNAIIIVPANYYIGNIYIDNARQFLVDSNYIPQEQEVKPANSSKRDLYSFKRKIKGKEMNFEIRCDVNKFSQSDWKRVVAVFVQGNDWEFKDWPKEESIISIFTKIRGFHLKYNDLPSNDNVKKWNVKILEISRSKRHFDVSIQNEFWTVLEEFLSQPRYREKKSKYQIIN